VNLITYTIFYFRLNRDISDEEPTIDWTNC